MIHKVKTSLVLALLWAIGSVADNPIVNYHYLADPTAFVIDDTFWIICDLDDESVTGYNIKAYYALSTKDMVNWTDHGEVFRTPRDVPWAGAAWAPAAVYRNEKVYIYYPNSTAGIGVVVANSPVGPFMDPVGKPIVDHNDANGNYCDNVVWCFDPGVFVDTDGQAYLIWGGGGGEVNKPSYDHNFRMMKLNSDMVSLNGALIKVDITNNSGNQWTQSFEAPYITKRNDIYYLSYNTRGQTIGYATSSSPMGPWIHKGIALANPNIGGVNINANNNSHHGFAEFKGKWYAAYHDRRMAISKNDSRPDLHRSISIDVLEFNADGTIKNMTYTNVGPAAVGTFNPYDSIPGTTGSKMHGIGGKTVLVPNAPPYSMLTPLPTQTAWTRLSNVNFGTTGASKLMVNAASLANDNQVEIRIGSENGALAGTCLLQATGSWSRFETNECDVSGLTGVIPQLYVVFTGASDSTCGIKWWKFKPTPEPRTNYIDAIIPGKIEAENYDRGGEGVAYHDIDAENKGDIYRNDGVDITGDSTSGFKVGWTQAGEWLEYTVDIKTAGSYDWSARVASGLSGSALQLYLDRVAISDTIFISNGDNWEKYVNVQGTTNVLSVGTYKLRLSVVGSYFNIDWIEFTLKDSATDIQKFTTLPANAQQSYNIYTITGQLIGAISIRSGEKLDKCIRNIVNQPGIYLAWPQAGGGVQKVAITPN